MKPVIGIVRPEQKTGLSKTVRFEVAVSDSCAQPTVDALCEDGRTGEVGDGNAAPLGDQALAAPAYAFGATFVLLKLIGALTPLRASGPVVDAA